MHAPSPIMSWIRLSDEPGHFTFGYYDRYAWDEDNAKHLALRIPHQDHMPLPGETAEVGVIDRTTRCFTALAETRTWCHQQGCMSLWLPQRPGHIVYNDFDDDAGVVARILTLDRQQIGTIVGGLYALSTDGRWGVSLNFGRIPRRGYSYALTPLPVADPWPAKLDADGLFLIDMQSGTRTLIASYRRLIEAYPHPWDLDGERLWLNHAIFNCDSSRVMVLFRHCPVQGRGGWKTCMMTMNLDGSELMPVLSDLHWKRGGISHQIWGRTPREVLVDANWCGRGNEYVVFDESHWPMQATRISAGMGPMGHLNFSPDGSWLAADTYANEDGMQRLALIRVRTGECRLLGEFRHQQTNDIRDLRCDLHPRWSRDGSFLTVDTIHDGERKVYMLEMDEVYAQFDRLPGLDRSAT